MTAPAPTAFAQYSYRRSPDQDRAAPARHPVVVIGAGPVGLALAVDLAQRGVPVVLLDDSDRIGDGSRAICFAKRTLEIFDRLGVGARAIEKGVRWQVGRVFHGDALLYRFDLLPEPGHKMPAFVNLQQYYVEKYLVDRVAALPLVDLRWRNRVAGVEPRAGGATLAIKTPDGAYALDADWVVACDGARSSARVALGLDFAGEQFEEQFLIADVKMTAAFPTERWFWFAPPFHAGRSALLHKQPDDIWRIDLQLSPAADSEHERRADVVRPRIARMLGHEDFELEWVSVYRFQCRRIEHFVHGRVVFAGDSAHQVSPFGARGANSGIQDGENLGWKLAAVIAGTSPASLIDSYHDERAAAADENIGHSTRSTDFIAPQSAPEQVLRDAALALAATTEFAKRWINPGRLSTASSYAASPLSTPDIDPWSAGPPPGAAMPDCPLVDADGRARFLSEVVPARFVLLVSGAIDRAVVPDGVDAISIGDGCGWRAADDLFRQRFDFTPGAGYLIRPDSHVAARWRVPTRAGLAAALARASGRDRGAPALGGEGAITPDGGGMPPLPTYANGGEGIATVSRLADPDAAFRALIAAHRGLSDADSAALNARLVLLLANHIGDVGVLRAALRVARSKNSEPAGGGDGLV